MPMLEGNRLPEFNPAPIEAGSEQKQRRQMLAALALLLVALIAVFLKDRTFWEQYLFPSPAAESDTFDQAPDSASQHSSTQTASPAPVKPKPRAAAAAAPAPPVLSPVVTSRAVLPPLEVEVVAGDQRQTIRPGNPSIKVDLQPRSPVPSSPQPATRPSESVAGGGVATDAADRVRLSPGTAEVVSHPVEPNYPLLARQMKVQGSVVLQALIGKEGTIQDLQVLSGPTILSAAAREAVKQWRFRPYLQSGQPVETEARITVNFTISTQ